jgi:hypothetical protein
MQRSIIQYIRQAYVNDLIIKGEILSKITSCEFTTLIILVYLKRIKLIMNTPSTVIGYKIPTKQDSFILEVILFRRSHTFLIVKDNNRVYMVSAYMHEYKSHIEERSEDLDILLEKIYMTEFEDNFQIHKDLFKVDKIPCLTLDKSLSRMKINLYEINEF